MPPQSDESSQVNGSALSMATLLAQQAGQPPTASQVVLYLVRTHLCELCPCLLAVEEVGAQNDIKVWPPRLYRR
jgi:hypothetical protein